MTINIHEFPTPFKSRAYPIASFKERDDWIKLLLAANADELSLSAKIVATRVAFHLNIESGQCNPSLPQLAVGSGMSVRNVRRMLNELDQAGWLVVRKSSGGRRSADTYNANLFELALPVTRTDVSALNPDNSVRVSEPNPDKPGGLTRTNGDANPDTAVTHIKANLKANRKAKETDSPRLDLDLDDSGRRGRDLHLETDANFEIWYQRYPKQVDKPDALRAYRAVTKNKLATPEQLVAAAMSYAAERIGQDPRFTKNPATWLKKQSWMNEPASTGGGSMSPPARTDHIAVAEQLARQAMAKKEGGHVR